MDQIYKLDLHTHSIISHDGGITDEQYHAIFSDSSAGKNFVAITDHNEISKALSLRQKFGEQVIVGEEILSSDGEIIGLFLKEKIQPNLSAEETARQIQDQGGLVYIPHPLEKSRKGLPMEILNKLAAMIDLIEVFNARLREPWFLKKVEKFTLEHGLIGTASSDAHGIWGFGSAYAELAQAPNRGSLVSLVTAAKLVKNRAPLISFLYPTTNRLKKKFNL
jgi:predicted metal-dependent phosphoesterase TrpH